MRADEVKGGERQEGRVKNKIREEMITFYKEEKKGAN